MDRPQGRAMLSGFAPNGLLPNKATSLTKELDRDRWSRAERRTAELLAQILPNPKSEEQRNSVVSYMRRLITKCTPCQVFPFGSVPLKTYLPDGDIDLTAFSDNQYLKDSLVHEVREILESEEKNENAEFHVREVQYIQAEVTILKCLVDNFVVDISFNQLSGLCTLCFLEEVDNLIRQNHLFKCSIILIKAWCYHESRILGAHHGLISSYALETLVLYIFHVYNNKFAGPLEVLFRFLDFFSKFDWNNYCISLWGPVPISSLPNMRADPPRKDSQELLLGEAFLNACKSFYGVKRSSLENQEQPFISKYLNIVDPLCTNNNLGRSISKGNFFRIKSAISFGAQRLMRLLNCPEDNLIAEFDYFFRSTWDRHGKGHWIDLKSYNLLVKNMTVENSTHHESEVDQAKAFQGSHGICQKPGFPLKESKGLLGTSDVSSVSQTWSTKTNDIFTAGTMTSDVKHTSSMKSALTDKGKSPMYSSNEGHDMHLPPWVHSTPDFDHLSSEVPPQHKQNGVSERENGNIHSASLMIDNNMRSSSISEVLDNHNIIASAENQHSFGKILHDWRSEDAVDTKDAYYCEFGLGENNEIGLSVDEAMLMNQEEHDLMNISETYRNHSFNGYLQEPFDVNSSDVPFPPPPPGFPPLPPPPPGFSPRYTHVPPSFESSWGPYSEGLVPLPADGGMTLNQEEITEPVDYNVVAAHLDHDNSGEGLWSEQDIDGGSSSCNSSWWAGSGSYLPKDYWETTEDKWFARGNDSDDPPDKITIDGDMNSTTLSRYTPALPSTTRTKLASSIVSPSLTSQPLDTDLAQSTIKIVTSDVKAHQLGQGPMNGPDSSVPDTPVLVSPGSRPRAVDNKELPSSAFGSSGPQFPSTTKFPFHNLPTETGFPYSPPANHMDMDADQLGILQACLPSVSLDSPEKSRQVDGFLMPNQINLNVTSEPYVKQRGDILKADFLCHWLNLQYGRLCENSQFQEPMPYAPPVAPPLYSPLPGQFLWQFPPRILPDLMNNMALGPPLFPMMPNHWALGINAFNAWIYQRYAGLGPRFSGGTGTFLPDPISYQDRYFRRKSYSDSRTNRGNSRYERKDSDEERDDDDDDWDYNPRERYARRGQFLLGDLFERMGRMNQRRQNKKRNSRNNASTPNNQTDANEQNDNIDPPPIISTGTNDEADHQGESSNSASNELENLERDSADHQGESSNSASNELENVERDSAEHQGESSNSVSNELENVERDSADPSPHQPSTPNSPGAQD